MIRRLRPLAARGLLAYLAAQLLVIGTLSAIDALRKRYRAQGAIPRIPLPPVRIGDSEVRLYTYGEDLYAAMLHAIERAHTQILLETFIWKDDRVGRRFKEELHRAAARGVAVHVIFDSFANLVVPRRFKRFAPIVHALEYPLLTWPWHPLHLRSYARDHRKILVVDGAMAFVGGYNTGRPYATTWRDTHARIAGPSAGEMENVFVDFWKSHRGRGLPAIPNRGFLHILYGSPSLYGVRCS